MTNEKKLIYADDARRAILEADPKLAYCIERIKAVDAVEVVYGRWVDNGIPESILSGCSVCGFTCGAYSFNYCPNCGAKMDGHKDGSLLFADMEEIIDATD